MAQISVSIHDRLLEILQQMVEVIPGKYRIGANSGDTSTFGTTKNPDMKFAFLDLR